MQDPTQIWELGRWIARREMGTVRLSWRGGEVVLGVRCGRVHRADGLDLGQLAARLGCNGVGADDLLAEARAMGRAHGIPETRAMSAAKELIQGALRAWLEDPDRALEVTDREPREANGATISVTHALVELILADTTQQVADAILPDRSVRLRRAPGFLELYAPLRLSEEADLVVAGITGERTAAAIAAASPHSPDEVARLVAALVATGMLEPIEPAPAEEQLEWPTIELPDDEPVRRKIPVWAIAAAAALVLVVAVVAFLLLRGGDDAVSATVGTGDWGVVVEMGCEPPDLQRMLRKRNAERKALRTVKADPANGDTCFRLIWGSFPTKEDAEAAVGEVPPGLVESGFQPHVVEVPVDTADDGMATGE
jgi:hypothetical protein